MLLSAFLLRKQHYSASLITLTARLHATYSPMSCICGTGDFTHGRQSWLRRSFANDETNLHASYACQRSYAPYPHINVLSVWQQKSP
jgi:hypothetical protein